MQGSRIETFLVFELHRSHCFDECKVGQRICGHRCCFSPHYARNMEIYVTKHPKSNTYRLNLIKNTLKSLLDQEDLAGVCPIARYLKDMLIAKNHLMISFSRRKTFILTTSLQLATCNNQAGTALFFFSLDPSSDQ